MHADDNDDDLTISDSCFVDLHSLKVITFHL